jgi:hypothetical protein
MDQLMRALRLFCLLAALLLVPVPAGAQAQPQGDVFLCAACPVVESFLIGGLTLSEELAAVIGSSLQMLIGVVLAVWLLYEAARLFLPFGPADRPGKIFTGVFARTGLALAVVLALSPGAMRIYQNYVIYPLIGATVDVSNHLLKAAHHISNPGQANAYVCSLPEQTEVKAQLAREVSCQTDQVTRVIWRGLEIGLRSVGMGILEYGPDGTPRPKNAEQNIFQQAVGGVQSLLNTMGATWNLVMRGPAEYLMQAFMRILQVMVVIGTFAYAWAFYPLYMMNVVMKWAIISILWPLLAAAFIFPSTRSTSINALKGLFHASLSMIFLAATAGVMISILEPMFMELNRDHPLTIEQNAQGSVSIQDSKYWLVVLSGFILTHMMKKSTILAGTFTGSRMDTEIADGLWKMIKQVAWITADLTTMGRASMVRKKLPKQVQ